jgi:predicted RNA binding protein YcfA (HicA-like mRNA interferase family)
MKKKQLLKELNKLGCVFVRHGGNHDWYKNPITGVFQAIPRHNEINEFLAKSILKKLK